VRQGQPVEWTPVRNLVPMTNRFRLQIIIKITQIKRNNEGVHLVSATCRDSGILRQRRKCRNISPEPVYMRKRLL
jgi:hypothetical protein